MPGLSGGRDDPALLLRPQVVRVSLWAVLGLWLARRLFRLLLLIVRSPAAMIAITLTAAFVAGWQLVHPALPLGVVGGLVVGLVVWRWRWPASFDRHAYDPGAGVVARPRGCTGGAGRLAMDTIGLTKERHGTDYVPPLRRDPVQPVDGPGHGADAARPAAAGLGRRRRPARPNLRRRSTAGSASTRTRSECSCGSWSATPSPAVVPPLPPDLDPGRLWSTASRSRSPRTAPCGGSGSSASHVLLVGATGAGKSAVLWAHHPRPGAARPARGWSSCGRSTPRAAWNSPPAGRCSTGSPTATLDQPRLRNRARRPARGRRRGDAPPRRPADAASPASTPRPRLSR